MARINLLPWRAELRKQKQREFLATIGASVFLMVLVIGFFHLQITGEINHQKERNEILSDEIKIVEAQIEEIKNLEKQKQELVARTRVIEQLQRDRPSVVHLFDEIVKATPDGLHLTSMIQKGKVVVIEGVAQSNARVSALMRNVDASPWLESPSLEVIQLTGKGDQGVRTFKLTVKQSDGNAQEAK